VTTNTGNFDNPLILAIETSGRLGSVALAAGDKLLSETSFSGPMRHSAEIFPAVTDLLGRFSKKPDQIEHVYISVGPGSFTGLRIAVTFAKTMALANNSKIVAVDTLDVIAANVLKLSESDESDKSDLSDIQRLAVILDAKRGQFFIAVYEKTQDVIWKKVFPDCLIAAEEFLDRFAGCGKPIALIGEGLVYYKDKFSDPAVQFLDEKYWNPSAINIHKLGWHKTQIGEFSDPLTLIPNYIRGPDVTIKQI
jgi:tRNA threonylcarbamoyladenosine biosynthesis protein TsaB